MIEILAHRGCWDTKMVKGNTLEAFKLAWNLGYGIETDVRDVGGEVVIEHDPFGVGKIKLEDVFKICDKKLTIALNIKSDGLAERIRDLILKYQIKKYFVFDMSIPDTLEYVRNNLILFRRISDLEPNVIFLGENGYWKDELVRDICLDDIIELNEINLPVCVVSPELHNRKPFSKKIIDNLKKISKEKKLYICTDKPKYYD